MGDFGKGLKSFKKSMKEDEETTAEAGADPAKPALKTEQVEGVQAEPKKDKAAQG
jgi:Sec-independent protein translocase protein TatA